MDPADKAAGQQKVEHYKNPLVFRLMNPHSCFIGFAKYLWGLDFRLLHTWTYASTKRKNKVGITEHSRCFMITKIRIATRQSALALWQANYVAKLINQFWPKINIELLPMLSSGDKFLTATKLASSGKNLFVKELEQALLANQADLAVHSMKDVPTIIPPGLTIAAICKRENPLDLLIMQKSHSLSTLPKQAIIGTSSLRRQAQLLAMRPDLQIIPLRGNINSRLKRLVHNEFDAIVLAAAGVLRLNLPTPPCEILSAEFMLPACGQGAVGIECRMDDQITQQLLTPLNDPLSASCVHNERYISAALGGNCRTSLAVFCQPDAAGQILMRAKVLSPDGNKVISDKQHGHLTQLTALAKKSVKSLLRQGAATLLTNCHE